MDYFYDGQIKRYLTQFMRLMSNFSYKDAKGILTEVPVRYGDVSRQVAQIINKNSENILQSAPFIACYIKDIQYDRSRLSDPTFVSKVQVRERSFNEATQHYGEGQGGGYTVERLMPTPYTVTFAADLWTTNTDQKLQLWEQITVLFNPSLELQSTDNYIDWSSLSVVELTSQKFETRSIPQGLEADISVCNLEFTCPIWINPPAKVKKLGIITKIISNVFVSESLAALTSTHDYKDDALADLFVGQIPTGRSVVTPGNFSLVVLNNVASLVKSASNSITSTNELQNRQNWLSILDLYPGQFRAGLSQLRLMKDNKTEIIAYMSLNPLDDFSMVLTLDQDTVPLNTLINGRGTVDAIIDPVKFDPRGKPAGTRYLILDDINIDLAINPGYSGPAAWKNQDGTDFVAHANDIIEWDGAFWSVLFDSTISRTTSYVRNTYTGIQYKWDLTEGAWQWTKSYEGVYDPSNWRLVL